MPERSGKEGQADASKAAPEGTEDKKPIGEIIEEAGNKPGGDKKPEGEPETVPLATFLDMKKDAKKFEKLFNDLKEKKQDGASDDEVSGDLDALAEEFDIEPKFVKKLAKILEGKAEKKAGEALKPLMEQNEKLSKKEREEAIDKAFKKHYAEALETMPEYKEIANADAIKALSLLKENANKTFAQLIEETYGKAITGKRTIDSTKPGGGKEPSPLDMDKARKDTKYFEEVMSDPVLKAEYNKRMLEPTNRRS